MAGWSFNERPRVSCAPRRKRPSPAAGVGPDGNPGPAWGRSLRLRLGYRILNWLRRWEVIA